MFSNVDGERSRISSSGTSQGGASLIFSNVDGRRSWISSSDTSQGASSMFLSVGGGRYWIFSFDTSQGVHCQRFLMLMVGALRSSALAPPRGPVVDVF
jgi:hypothetical protein